MDALVHINDLPFYCTIISDTTDIVNHIPRSTAGLMPHGEFRPLGPNGMISEMVDHSENFMTAATITVFPSHNVAKMLSYNK